MAVFEIGSKKRMKSMLGCYAGQELSPGSKASFLEDGGKLLLISSCCLDKAEALVAWFAQRTQRIGTAHS